MKTIVGAADRLLPPTMSAMWGERGMVKDLLKVGLKNVPNSAAPVMQAVRREDPLKGLPFLTSWQDDGGPLCHTAARIYGASSPSQET